MKHLVISAGLALVTFAWAISEAPVSHGEDAWLVQDMQCESRACASDVARVAPAANILLFGDATGSGFEPGPIHFLRDGLLALGHSVTVSPLLPEDLHVYDTIWHVGSAEPILGDEQARLVEFVNAGRGLHLTGERDDGVITPLSESLQELLERLGIAGIQVGGLGTIRPPDSLFGPYPINPEVLGDLSMGVDSVGLVGPGGVDGALGERNILIRGRNEIPVAAVWEGRELVCGAGALSLVMDNGWLGRLSVSDSDNAQLLANLQLFLTGDGIPGNCDEDGDGVPDADDACPGTAAGEIVDETGCSIADLCPCDADWKNHGAYTSCVARTADAFVAAGLISEVEKGRIVSAAARSDCGKQVDERWEHCP